MEKEKKPKAVKLFAGVLYNNEIIRDKAFNVLESKFSKIDYASKPILFFYTDYYRKEMGEKIFRQYISFSHLIKPYELGKIKHITDEIEKKFSTDKRRNINIDAGYISLHNLILATTKDYSHRIMISKKIYAEVTLIYNNKTFNPLPWTYPDYKDPENIKDFIKIREILQSQIK